MKVRRFSTVRVFFKKITATLTERKHPLFPKIFFWSFLFLFFLTGCSTNKTPLLDGPFLNKKIPPSSEEKLHLLGYLHGELGKCLGVEEGKEKGWKQGFPTRWEKFSNPFQIKIWHQGEKLFGANASGEPLKKAFGQKLKEACKALKWHKIPKNSLHQLKIQIALAYGFQGLDEKKLKEKRRVLSNQFGLWGLLVLPSKENQWWYPSEYLEKYLKFNTLFENICGSGNLPRDCAKKMKGELRTFQNFDFVGSLDPLSYQDLYRLSPLVDLSSVNPSELSIRLELMRDWFINNIDPDGKMTYVYYPSKDKRTRTHNNMIRQFMATLALFRLGHYLEDPALLEAAEKNLSFNLKEYMKLEEPKQIAYIYFRKKAKLGAAAFALMAMLESKTHPERDKLIAWFTNLILSLQNPDGSFRTFYLPVDRNDNQFYYPGEAMLALMTLYEKNPAAHGSLLKRMEKSFQYYREFFRKKSNPAFVPWQTMALYRLYQKTHGGELAPFIFEMNDFLIEIQNTPRTTYTPQLDTMGRFYDPKKRGYGPPHASSTGIYVEGLIDALNLAIELKDEKRVESYRYAIRWGLRSLFQLQYTPKNIFYIHNRAAVIGALHTSVVNGNIRVDNTQHATMALLNLLTDPQALQGVFPGAKKSFSKKTSED